MILEILEAGNITCLSVVILLSVIALIFLKEKLEANCAKRITVTITEFEEAKRILNNREKYSRALPNAGIATIFQISNLFTDDKEDYRKAVRRMLLDSHMKVKPEKYHNIFETAHQICTEECVTKFINFDVGELRLAEYVQAVTLGTFGTHFLDIRGLENDGPQIGSLINQMWSKKTIPDCPEVKAMRRQLNAILQGYQNDDATDACGVWSSLVELTAGASLPHVTNLLNIIIPGFETMWRVVLYFLLEVIRRPQLLQDIRQEQLDDVFVDPHGLLASTIWEILRMYPPTKSIYRWSRCGQERIVIDVMKINTSHLWGKNPKHFIPRRFQESNLPTWSLASFGVGNTRCVAADSFAPRFLAAICLACLQLPFSNIKLAQDQLPKTSQPLVNNRTCYENIVFQLKP